MIGLESIVENILCVVFFFFFPQLDDYENCYNVY